MSEPTEKYLWINVCDLSAVDTIPGIGSPVMLFFREDLGDHLYDGLAVYNPGSMVDEQYLIVRTTPERVDALIPGIELIGNKKIGRKIRTRVTVGPPGAKWRVIGGARPAAWDRPAAPAEDVAAPPSPQLRLLDLPDEPAEEGEEEDREAMDAWVHQVNTLAAEIDEWAASMHPSGWHEALAPRHAEYERVCHAGPQPRQQARTATGTRKPARQRPHEAPAGQLRLPI